VRTGGIQVVRRTSHVSAIAISIYAGRVIEKVTADAGLSCERAIRMGGEVIESALFLRMSMGRTQASENNDTYGAVWNSVDLCIYFAVCN
jgi:hypothetical protein